ncbi:MAG TPA: VanW family protein [Acidimicrobiia bacterium]|nr:VanW family protein [Acidimicrobiia bacterium]
MGIALAVSLVPLPAFAGDGFDPSPTTPGGSFYDDDGSTHEGAIEALFAAGITKGCGEELFCPGEPVTRGQMAAFLTRAFPDLLPATQDWFVDDQSSIFESAINVMAENGITLGCNPPTNDRYCPQSPVTRGQMAAFFDRVLGLEPASTDFFTDDGSSPFQEAINRLAEAGITKGCNPPANDLYCPTDHVTRAQMASFLGRALGLDPLQPPPRPQPQRLFRFTTYFQCCQPRVTNIRLIARTVNGALVLPGETFSVNDFVGPRTTAKGYVEAGTLQNGEPSSGVGGGISQFATTLYYTVFRAGLEDVEHKPHSRYFDRYPVGIEATLAYPSVDVAFRNDTWTPVTIRTSSTSTSVTVELWGNTDGRKVSFDVDCYDCPGSKPTYSGGGSVRIDRTLTERDGSKRHQTWFWTYIGS